MTPKEQLKKIKEKKPGGTKTIMYQGKNQTLPWHEIPVNLLKYNYVNGRIASNTKEFKQLGKDLNHIDPKEAKKTVGDWLWNKSVPANKKTLEDLRKNNQIEAGVVTSDGIIVDGNRRFMLTCRLNGEDANQRLFKAVILDETYSDNKNDSLQLKLLETKLQITKDEKVNYDPIEKYIRIKEFIEYHKEGQLKKESVIDLFNLKNVRELEEKAEVANLMESYLEYIKAPNMWSRLKNTEDLFINLESCLRLYNKQKGRAGWSFGKADVLKFKKTGFDIIRWVHNSNSQKTGWDAKKVRPLFFKNSEGAIFYDQTVFDEFTKTLSEETRKIKVPSIEQHVEQNNSEQSVAAEHIDKDWANKINNTMLGALGRAETKISDKKKKDRPADLIEDSLHKLENLIDINKFKADNMVKIEEYSLKNLGKEREKNYKLVDNIRRIAEALKKALKD